MKVVRNKIGQVNTTRLEFEDGSVWEQVHFPPEFLKASKTREINQPKAVGILLPNKNCITKLIFKDES